MIHAGAELAHRPEGLICDEWRRLAELSASLWPERGATYLEVAGGVALWLGEDQLVNVATGLAMDGPPEEGDLRAIEDFYSSRGTVPMVATCPFADPSLFMLLGAQGWRLAEFENALALEPDLVELDAVEPNTLEPAAPAAATPAAAPERAPAGLSPTAPAELCASGMVSRCPRGVELRVCESPDERELFGRIAARGFSDGDEPGPAHLDFGRLMAAHRDHILVMAWIDGRPAATASVKIQGDVAWLSADSTLPEFRRRGIQQVVQRFRIDLARKAGCRLVVTESVPGSGSQRNMERLGFRVIYPHLHFVKV